jgi:phosphatidylglycerol:prolipoprotein diacylglycerol transferase
MIQVAFDEWPFYREHLRLVPALWLGGMATHGLLLGAAAAVCLFSHGRRVPLRVLADAVVIPGAFLLGVGRIGNFLDGQIVGSVTDVWWAVKFPDADGFRHPVVLYDGLKNLLLIPLLLWVRRTHPWPGATAAHFVFWYAFLRIFVDLFRDYPTHRLALGAGQTLNIVMACVGLALLVRSYRRAAMTSVLAPPDVCRPTTSAVAPGAMRIAFLVVLLFCLPIPSNWTQDRPARYGTRHPGIQHAWLYPAAAQ